MADEDGLIQLMRQKAGDVALEQNRREIEQAIDKVKHRKVDKELMRQFFRSRAMSVWSDRRWRRYSEWLRKQKQKEEGRGSQQGLDPTDGEPCQKADRGEPEDGWWRLGPMGPMRRDRGRRKWRPRQQRRSPRPGTDAFCPGPSDGWRR